MKTNFDITNYFSNSDLPKIQTCAIIPLKKLFHLVGWKYRISTIEFPTELLRNSDWNSRRIPENVVAICFWQQQKLIRYLSPYDMSSDFFNNSCRKKADDHAIPVGNAYFHKQVWLQTLSILLVGKY